MKIYVQLKDNKVVGISQVNGPLEGDNLIEVSDYFEDLLGSVYSDGEFKKSISIEETDEYTTYQWHKFNLEKGEYEPDLENTNPIKINGIEYPLVDGVATVPKEKEVDTLELLGQQLAEEKIKNIQNTAIINQLGQELTELKLQLMGGSDE